MYQAPTDVFCTGLYDGRDSSRHAKEAVAYEPGLLFWSDGAEKSRFLMLPAGSRIDTTDMDAWKFPIGTKAWKEFRLEGKLVETRLLWKRGEGDWTAAVYIWNTDQTAAPLNTARTGTLLPSGYEIPTAYKTCQKCHSGSADELLGVEAVSLGLPTAKGITLEVLASQNLLSAPPATTKITLPEDGTGKAAGALGYLHVNCGMACHSSRALANETKLDMRLRAADFWPPAGAPPSTVAMTAAYTTAVGQPVKTQTYVDAFPGAKRITPGAHDQSATWRVSHLRGMFQMPPIVSHKIDEAGTQTLAGWIDALPKP